MGPAKVPLIWNFLINIYIMIPPAFNPKFKTTLCKHWMNSTIYCVCLAGNCTIGTRCHFAHGQSELRNPNDVFCVFESSPFLLSIKDWCKTLSYSRCALLVHWVPTTWRSCHVATILRTFVVMEIVVTMLTPSRSWNRWLILSNIQDDLRMSHAKMLVQ